MTQIIAYLTFDGNCAEAMNFYKDCTGGELMISHVEDTPVEGACGQAAPGAVMHAHLSKGSLQLMASDMMMGGELIRGNAVALSLNCSSEEEIRSYFDKLSAGGTDIHPLKLEFWGALFGMFTDKFGLRWLLNFDKN
ncbi:MAG: VOC family protein [Pedobacter sp.]|uniref:VOC family protein n=1 Tax=Pedobacter sp. TaxID=1411316 RepID=UPI0033943CDF